MEEGGTYIFPYVPEYSWEVLSGVIHCLHVEQDTFHRVREVHIEPYHSKHDGTSDDGIRNN